MSKSVLVYVTVKRGFEDAFIKASLENAENSRKEKGIAAFDVMRQADDPCKFVLCEVYLNEEAPAEHKKSAHYLKWRETVADMMAEPREGIWYISVDE